MFLPRSFSGKSLEKLYLIVPFILSTVQKGSSHNFKATCKRNFENEIIPDDEKTIISILETKSLKKFKKMRFSRIDS